MRSAVADPVVLVLLLLLGGLGVGRIRRRLGAALLLGGIATLYLLALPPVAERLLQRAERPLAVAGAVAAPQAIVILGAGVYQRAPEYGGETVDALSLERIRYGARLHRRTGLPILVTGAGPGTTSVAGAMGRALAEDFGVPVRWVDERARTTHENATRSAAILRAEGLETVYLVTHAAHMPRAQQSFARAGLAVVPAPTVVTVPGSDSLLRRLIPRTTTLVRSFYALHELTGRLWYHLAYGEAGARAAVPPRAPGTTGSGWTADGGRGAGGCQRPDPCAACSR